MPQMLILKILNGKRQGDIQELRKTASCGRSGKDNELVLSDQTISGIHALFTFDEKNWWVQDNQSANGTWADGVEASRPVLLRPHGRLRLGPEIEIDYSIGPDGGDAEKQRLLDENQQLRQEISRLERELAERPQKLAPAGNQASQAALIRLIEDGLAYAARFGDAIRGLMASMERGTAGAEEAKKLLREANRSLADLRAHFELARPE